MSENALSELLLFTYSLSLSFFSSVIHSEHDTQSFIQNMLFNLVKWEIIIKQAVWPYEYWSGLFQRLTTTLNVVKAFRRL